MAVWLFATNGDTPQYGQRQGQDAWMASMTTCEQEAQAIISVAPVGFEPTSSRP